MAYLVGYRPTRRTAQPGRARGSPTTIWAWVLSLQAMTLNDARPCATQPGRYEARISGGGKVVPGCRRQAWLPSTGRRTAGQALPHGAPAPEASGALKPVAHRLSTLRR